ncbi:proline dehydrogenase [Bacillus aquiflavi]|uniref:proline dehydrogenase n=1 Tax=Bacillus aquiflavi TaxID=2672567 RepID=A0A6B3VYA3_9BACI|nr:proline dehydrogenase [Bacillus aquiflavi]MBA4535949.1 proline dehydrogenase [Bacillus aquiflavi]NEY80324.1 proline dehydrogenase [Bacillus aquiflavi]
MIETISKNFFLRISESKFLNKAARKWGLKFGAGQVVAGETIDSAIKKVRELNDKGLVCTLDHLGEFVSSKEEASEATQYCIDTLDAIAKSGVECNLSVKMTQLGLDIDKDFCLNNMKKIVSTAKKYDNFVRIDMEDSPRCQVTMDILKELRKEYDNVGTVIQAYLFRSQKDVEDLAGVPLRLVKGAYKEPAEVAFQEKQEVDKNYLKIIQTHLLSGSYTAIASHDHRIIEKVKEFVESENISHDQFEFQMLYGFRNELQLSLVKEGYKVRVYVPYGDDWFGYFMRRLAERPQNVSFAFKGFFSK